MSIFFDEDKALKSNKQMEPWSSGPRTSISENF